MQAGWSASDAVTATAIAMAESGGNTGVTNSIGATGIWQIYDGPGMSQARFEQLRDPVENAKEAYAKWVAAKKGGATGWCPWASYNEDSSCSGQKGRVNTWRQFLAQAQSAASGVDGSGGAVSTVDPVLAGGAALVTAQSSAGTLDASPILGSQALGTLVGRVASPGFWWAAGFFLLAGVLILVGLLVVFHQQVEQAATSVGKVAAVAA
jgi:hypothetical protein